MNEPRPDLPSLSRLPPPSQQDSGLLLSLGHLFPVDMEDGMIQSLVLRRGHGYEQEKGPAFQGLPQEQWPLQSLREQRPQKLGALEGQDFNDSTLPWALPSAEGKQRQ